MNKRERLEKIKEEMEERLLKIEIDLKVLQRKNILRSMVENKQRKIALIKDQLEQQKEGIIKTIEVIDEMIKKEK